MRIHILVGDINGKSPHIQVSRKRFLCQAACNSLAQDIFLVSVWMTDMQGSN
jgi:hypothetical protein